MQTGLRLKEIPIGIISIQTTPDINRARNTREAINTGHQITEQTIGIIINQAKNSIITNTIIGIVNGKDTVGTMTVGVIIMDIITHIHIVTTNIIITTIIMDT